MWIFDKLFNRKIEGKSSLDDLAENVVVNKETNTTEVGGNLDVDGNFTANSIIENMNSNLYHFDKLGETNGIERAYNYVGVVKNGNKLTIVISGTLKRTSTSADNFTLGDFPIPNIVASKIFTYTLSPFDNIVANINAQCWPDFNTNNKKEITVLFQKLGSNFLRINAYSSPLEINTTYVYRIEQTFLLSDSLAGN